MNIIHQIMYTQIFYPSKNYYNLEFYSSIWFVFIKFCINGPTFWYADGSVSAAWP